MRSQRGGQFRVWARFFCFSWWFSMVFKLFESVFSWNGLLWSSKWGRRFYWYHRCSWGSVDNMSRNWIWFKTAWNSNIDNINWISKCMMIWWVWLKDFFNLEKSLNQPELPTVLIRVSVSALWQIHCLTWDSKLEICIFD